MSVVLEQIAKYNFRFYMKNFLKIRTKAGTLENLILNDAQEVVAKVIDDLRAKKKPIRIIILKARQMGISTFTEGFFTFDTATQPLRNTIIVAHEDKASQNLFNMSKLYYDELPDILKPMKKYSNESALVFENPTNSESDKRKNPGLRSKFTVATAKNVDTARSGTYHNVHASELAFWNNPKTLMLGMLQCVPDLPNTCVIIESTANGIGGYFYELWKGAERGENDFIPIFLPWFTDVTYTTPFDSDAEKIAFIQQVEGVTYDEKGRAIHTEEFHLKENFNLTYEQLHWRRKTIKNKCNGDMEQFQQEYPSTPDEAFIASGRPKFSISSLKKYNTKCKDGTRGYLIEQKGNITFLPDSKGYIEIFEKPVEGKNYSIGADVAEGVVDGDYSSAAVGENESFKIVAGWHGHIDPDLFGYELYKLAKYYNEAYIGCEVNNHGLTTLKKLQALEYWNIYYQKVYDQIREKMTAKVGWNTNRKTKPLMINKLAEFIREMHLDVQWRLFISECFTYMIGDEGDTNAQSGSHDDTVMSVAVLLQIMLEGRGDNYEPEITKDEARTNHYKDEDFVDAETLEISQ